MTNLLGNAVKFTEENGSISVSAKIDEDQEVKGGDEADDLFDVYADKYVRIAVTDTGIGIPEDMLGKIFETFYQVDGTSTREFGGTGLGLSIVKSFVEAHHGKVWAESKLGKGTRFVVLLPVNQPVE